MSDVHNSAGFRISLRFWGNQLIADSITEGLDLRPVEVLVKGERFKRGTMIIEQSVWISDVPSMESLEASINYIISYLESREPFLRNLLASGILGDLYVTFDFDESGTIDLTADTMLRIGKLGLGLLLCLYSFGPDT